MILLSTPLFSHWSIPLSASRKVQRFKKSSALQEKLSTSIKVQRFLLFGLAKSNSRWFFSVLAGNSASP
jgi:hypothetical protein